MSRRDTSTAKEGLVGRKIVLGLGNMLNHDEGLGLQALKALGGRLGPQHSVELIDGGVMGLDLLPMVEDADHLLVLDAINAGQTPGTVIELDGDAIPKYAGVKLSQHQMTFQELLSMTQLRGTTPPHLRLIGAQPEDLTLGIGLSETIENALEEMVERAAATLKAWGLIGS
jgi:hydrogenase maturation protease